MAAADTLAVKHVQFVVTGDHWEYGVKYRDSLLVWKIIDHINRTNGFDSDDDDNPSLVNLLLKADGTIIDENKTLKAAGIQDGEEVSAKRISENCLKQCKLAWREAAAMYAAAVAAFKCQNEERSNLMKYSAEIAHADYMKCGPMNKVVFYTCPPEYPQEVLDAVYGKEGGGPTSKSDA
jgi:hypothetical protein